MTAILADDHLENLIQNSLRVRLKTAIGDVSVDVIDGCVCLRGVARSYTAKKRAAAISQATVGVRSVINQLRILPH